MANLQIKNVPDEMHAELRRRATHHGMTQRDYVLELLRRDLERPSVEEWLAEVRRLPRVELDRPAAEFIREARQGRDRRRGHVAGH